MLLIGQTNGGVVPAVRSIGALDMGSTNSPASASARRSWPGCWQLHARRP